jgi:hypothetical protein
MMTHTTPSQIHQLARWLPWLVSRVMYAGAPVESLTSFHRGARNSFWAMATRDSNDHSPRGVQHAKHLHLGIVCIGQQIRTTTPHRRRAILQPARLNGNKRLMWLVRLVSMDD